MKTENRLFGFEDKDRCVIGKLRGVLISKIDPKYDLAVIDVAPDYCKIGLLSELIPPLPNNHKPTEL